MGVRRNWLNFSHYIMATYGLPWLIKIPGTPSQEQVCIHPVHCLLWVFIQGQQAESWEERRKAERGPPLRHTESPASSKVATFWSQEEQFRRLARSPPEVLQCPAMKIWRWVRSPCKQSTLPTTKAWKLSRQGGTNPPGHSGPLWTEEQLPSKGQRMGSKTEGDV